MRLLKYHGQGNDFLVLLDVEGLQPIDAALAVAVCDRHRGVGADGLIRATPDDGPADLTMELRNADGGRAETSGNGLRCLARAAVDAGWVGPAGLAATTATDLVVATDVGHRRATVRPDGLVSVEMGTVRVVDPGPERPPERDGEQPSGLGPPDPTWSGFADVGNPHVVFGVDDLEKVDLAADGRAWDRSYPGGINVEYAVAGPEAGGLTMRVWERGVGETLACGSGACAAAVVARQAGLVGDHVTVHQPGGDVTVDLSGDLAVLTGPATYICTVDFP